MSHTAFRTATAVTAAWLLALASAHLHAEAPRVVIRLYDSVSIDPAARDAAMRATAALLASAGLAVDWRDCTAGREHASCREPRLAGDLVMRVVPAWRPGRQEPLSAVSARRSPGEADVRLGVAAVDVRAGAGVVATVYFDRVQAVAGRAGIAAEDLLGRAMAHEIGHLLLREAGHGRDGLMRATWTDDELAGNRRGDWSFSAAERRRMQAAALQFARP